MTRKKGRFDYAAQALPEVPPSPSETEVKAVPEVLAQPAEMKIPSLPATHALQHPDAYALPPQQRGRRASAAPETPRRTDVPREQLNVRIRPELKRAAAGLAGLQGKTLGDVVEAALIEYLKAVGRQED